MSIAILLLLSFAVGVLGNLFSKWKSNMLKTDTLLRYALYLTLNGIVGSLFFLISAGFSLSTDWRAFFFGGLCALCVAVILISNIHLFRLASVAGVHVLISAGSLLGSAIYGSLLFGEVIDLRRILRIVLMLLAAYCIFLDSGGRIGRRKGGRDADAPAARSRGKTLLLILLLGANILASVGNSIAVRYYMLMTENADSHSLFCYTNLLLMIGAMVLFGAVACRHKDEIRPSMDTLRPLMLLLIAAATVASNIASLANAELVLLMDATVLSPVSSAITTLAAFTTSILILREPCGRYSIAAAVLALITVLLF